MGTTKRPEPPNIELNPDAPVIMVRGILGPFDRGTVMDFPILDMGADGVMQHVGTVRWPKAAYRLMMKQLYALQRDVAYERDKEWKTIHEAPSVIS